MASRQHDIKNKIVGYLRTVECASLESILDHFDSNGMDDTSDSEMADALNELYREMNITTHQPRGPFIINFARLSILLQLTPKGETTKRYR
jgi:hypothetical protein